jgi:[ribosomal protein S18]-alanine N-acetyltransferase
MDQASSLSPMPEPTLRIRPGRRDDIPALLGLEQAAETAAHWSPATYAELLPTEGQPSAVRRVVLVAEMNGFVCAFAIARVVVLEWEIENVVVAEGVRRQGIGRALVQAMTGAASNEEAERITLEVRESNLAARRLYEENGFAQCGLRPGYYRDPEEAAVLYKLSFQ